MIDSFSMIHDSVLVLKRYADSNSCNRSQGYGVSNCSVSMLGVQVQGPGAPIGLSHHVPGRSDTGTFGREGCIAVPTKFRIMLS